MPQDSADHTQNLSGKEPVRKAGFNESNCFHAYVFPLRELEL
jgi:hypothetical protein